jgi:NADH dehydrogenase (ubiquinone) 1 beta subcomplex subunit 8
MFMIEDYTHFTPARGFFLTGCFIASVFGLSYVVKLTYPDRPSYPRTWDDGLEQELGGPSALLVCPQDPAAAYRTDDVAGLQAW